MGKMPHRFLYSDYMCYTTYILAGGVGAFFTNLILKIIVTLISLIIASRFVHRYKEWNEKNPKRMNEFKRLWYFLTDNDKMCK